MIQKYFKTYSTENCENVIYNISHKLLSLYYIMCFKKNGSFITLILKNTHIDQTSCYRYWTYVGNHNIRTLLVTFIKKSLHTHR